MRTRDKSGTVLVIGGGISGMTAAIEATEAGCQVVLVEKNAYLGGRVAAMNEYFPKMCPPKCGLEINLRRIRTSPRIRTLTLASVEKISGGPGNYQATIVQQPRGVSGKCTGCGACVQACPVQRPDDFNFGMSQTKAIYLPFEMAWPMQYVIDAGVSPGSQCGKCLPACPYGAIELEGKPQTHEVQVEAVIWATGWEPYDAKAIDGLGFGVYPNVITNVMMERLAANNGPTSGKIQRPSDGGAIRSVAFVQCAGSRDENHLKHCSGVCCMASLKQVRYVREQYPDAKISLFYIDLRTPGRQEDFLVAAKEDRNLELIKGKAAKITAEGADGDLVVEAEDTLSGERISRKVSLVVLATGMAPSTSEEQIEGGTALQRDAHGFLMDEQPQGALLAAGCAKRPLDVAACVRDATGAALGPCNNARSNPVDKAEKKVSVWICRGCDIGKSLDVAALEKLAGETCGQGVCRSHDCLCGQEGVEQIAAAVRDGSNTLVVAGCSPRFNSDKFTFDGCLTERVNLREMVVWSHAANDEDTQMLAEDYLRMGMARAKKASVPEPFQAEIDKTILVVGGGVSGMTAAREAARAGYKVVLVEKEAQLGGHLTRFARLFPKKAPYRDLEPTNLTVRVSEIQADGRITICCATTVEKITGAPGQFDVSLKSNGSVRQLRVGAIVQATGWKPYDATRLAHLGYGKSPNVITNVQMEELAASGKITRPSDGKPARRIAFIQCAGSRDKNHLAYCSGVCCRVSLKQALWVRELDSEAQAYILYKDIRTPGQYEDFYARVQEDPGIFLTKGEVVSVEESGDGDLVVHADDTLLGKHIELEADLVVLATGMVPVAADGEAIRKYRDARAIVAKGEPGAQLEAAKATVNELAAHEGTDILKLGYRQGPDLPALAYNFPDSHFICFPYETRRTGIYAAGCMRAPNDTDACRHDAMGAAMKAIQSVELASRGMAVHPRWEDQSYPDFFMQRCTQCKRCTEECPFGALDEDPKGTPLPNPTRCRRCGICLGACPERIVSFKDYSIDIVSSMIKSVHIPDEFEEKPRLLGLVCENDAYPALDTAGLMRLQHSAAIRFIPVRCLGSVNVVWIADALARGFDGILLVGCKSGKDYQCHFIRGSELMKTRGENIREKLKQLALEESRVRVEELDISQFHKLPEIINEFAAQIEKVGLNPFKE